MAPEEQTRLDAVTGGQGASLASGDLLVHGTYEVLSRIGEGGMGEIYRARNTITGADSAIKMIRPSLIADPMLSTLFVREAEALKSIRDEAVVGYEGVFREQGDRMLLAMSYVDGPSLGQRMRERPLSTDEIFALADRLARGLAAAHAVGVHHRDLSPDNVLLPGGQLDHAVLIDFGIARRTGAAGPTLYGGAAQGRGFVGKLAYASPEQAGAVEGEIDHRTDIYSLGLVLAAASRGRPLDMGHDPMSAFTARKKLPDLSGIDPLLRPFLNTLLAPSPDERPQSMVEVREMASKLRRPRPLPDSGQKRNSRSWLLLPAGGIVVAVVGFAGYELLKEPPPAIDDRKQTEPASIPPLASSSPLAVPSTSSPPAHPPPVAILSPPAVPPPTMTHSETSAPVVPLTVPSPPTLSPPPASPPALAVLPPAPRTALPVSPTVTAPPAVDDAMLERAAQAITQEFPCATFDALVVTDGSIQPSGEIGSESELGALLQRLGSLSGATRTDASRLRVQPRPECVAAQQVVAMAGPAAIAPPTIRLNRADGIFTIGRDSLVIDVSNHGTRPVHAYVDFFQDNGEVYHLLPEPMTPDNRLAAGASLRVGNEQAGATAKDRVWEVSEPAGNGRIVVILSEQPLYQGMRELADSTDAYLAFLKRALPAAASTGAVAVAERPVVVRHP